LKKDLLFAIFLATILGVQGSCNYGRDSGITGADSTLISTDQSFSRMSEKRGMKKAFLNFIDENGVLLRPGHLPIIGAQAIHFINQENDSSFHLTWEVAGGKVARSRDIGYTYGIYTLISRDTTLKGTYVSIWKRQPDGKWKFILDSGNQGIGIMGK
jgi:ketosteroid isomerase-like protein